MPFDQSHRMDVSPTDENLIPPVREPVSSGPGGKAVIASPLAQRVPCDVTRVFPPLPPAVAAALRRRPNGLHPGYTDITPYEVPGGYGDHRIVAIVRDPNWIFAYWEVREDVLNRIRREHGAEAVDGSRLILRVHDVSGVQFDGFNSNRFFDVEVGQNLGSWYVSVPEPFRSYCLDLGLLTSDGRFILLARSNVVQTPPLGLSPFTDEEWMTIDEIYRMSVGVEEPLSSAALLHAISRRLAEQVGSGAVSSISSWMM